MGIVITASGLTRTILFEVIGEDTTIEDGLPVTTVETIFGEHLPVPPFSEF
jgi:hypothetical protein